MPRLHVCPLSRIDEIVAQSGARSMVTLINVGTSVARPREIAKDRHLFIGMSDIVAPMQGHVTPAVQHIDTLLSFVRAWDRADPLLIHCWAGVSRSTAAAFVSACALAPDRDEAADQTARVFEKFERLGRNGRMVEAIAAIGRGADCFEGVPFALPV